MAFHSVAFRWFGLRRSNSSKAVDKYAIGMEKDARSIEGRELVSPVNEEIGETAWIDTWNGDWTDFDGMNVFKADRAPDDAVVAAAAVPLPPDDPEEYCTNEESNTKVSADGDQGGSQVALDVAGAMALSAAMSGDDYLPTRDNSRRQDFDEEAQLLDELGLGLGLDARGRDLLQSIDDGIAKIRAQPWEANLPFNVYQCLRSEDMPPAPELASSSFVETNLFELTAGIHGLGKDFIACFNPVVYPVTSSRMRDNKESWAKLSTDLIRASKQHGNCVLASNGSYGNNQMILICSRSKYYKSTMQRASGEYRQHSMNRDKQYARTDEGKKQKKKTSTWLPVKENNDTTCKVKLVIGTDAYSFFVVCGIENGTHEGHPPLASEEMPTRKRTVPEDAKKLASQMAMKGIE